MHWKLLGFKVGFSTTFSSLLFQNPDGQRFRNVRIFHDDDRIVEGAGARWSFVDAFGCTSWSQQKWRIFSILCLLELHLMCAGRPQSNLCSNCRYVWNMNRTPGIGDHDYFFRYLSASWSSLDAKDQQVVVYRLFSNWWKWEVVRSSQIAEHEKFFTSIFCYPNSNEHEIYVSLDKKIWPLGSWFFFVRFLKLVILFRKE